MMDIFRKRKRNPLIIPIAVLAILGAGILVWLFLSAESADDSAAATEAITPAEVTAPHSPEATISPAETIVEPTPLLPQVPPTNTNPATPPAPDITVPGPAVGPVQDPPQVTPPATEPTSADFSPGSAMARAKQLADTGELVAARDAINPAIAQGQLLADDLRLAMQLQEQINRTLVFSARVLPGDEFSENYEVKSGDMLQRIAPRNAITAKLIQRINGISDPRRLRAGQTIKLLKGPFHAVVTKSAFRMDVYFGAPGGAGSTYVRSFPVGLGQDDSTPTGTWQVARGKKLVNPKYYDPRGGGEIEPDDPANPLGEFWIGLTGVEGEAVGKLSYGIHGTIEPDSVGKMASLGCIRMLHDDVELVYDMLVEEKSTVVIRN